MEMGFVKESELRMVVLFGTVAYSSAQLETGNGEWVVLFVTAAYRSDLLLIGS